MNRYQFVIFLTLVALFLVIVAISNVSKKTESSSKETYPCINYESKPTWSNYGWACMWGCWRFLNVQDIWNGNTTEIWHKCESECMGMYPNITIPVYINGGNPCKEIRTAKNYDIICTLREGSKWYMYNVTLEEINEITSGKKFGYNPCSEVFYNPVLEKTVCKDVTQAHSFYMNHYPKNCDVVHNITENVFECINFCSETRDLE